MCQFRKIQAHSIVPRIFLYFVVKVPAGKRFDKRTNITEKFCVKTFLEVESVKNVGRDDDRWTASLNFQILFSNGGHRLIFSRR